MWPLDLPARDILRLSGQTAIPWAEFDPVWYAANHSAAAASDTPAAILDYYLTVGQSLGHSPNRLFDEPWHRHTYPAIARGVAAGDFASAFDAYCRRGCLDRSAHWLFDELAYRDRYRDLTNEVLAKAQLANGYDHYLRHGGDEDRIGHLLFDATTYLANFDPRDTPAIRAAGAFQHYLNRIDTTEPELRTSIYFDPHWYVRRYKEVAEGIAARHWKCALHHYLCNDHPTDFDPSEHFSEAWYLQCDQGLRDVIAARHFHNGYAHFLRYGALEQRAPTASIDLAWYADQIQVRTDLAQGKAATAFAHWLTIGSKAGLTASRPAAERLTAAQARSLSQQAALVHLPIAGRFGYSFTSSNEGIVSVVMVVRDDFATTMATIASLRGNTARDIELIIIDCGSADETRAIGHYVPGATVLRFDSDIGWSRAADAGRQLASRPAVLFLSSAAQLALGSIERACDRLAADPSIGAIGGMIVQSLGVIGQAGGILWNNGGTHDYQRGASPLAPEANFVRTVDFCAPACILLRADLLTRLNGFDHDCADGYAGIDLCLRITEAGFRVVYDPSVLLFHDDPASRHDGPGSHFLAKHQAALAKRFTPGGPIQAFARHTGPAPQRILFIDDTVPLRRTGSGFVRSNDLIQVMHTLGCAVTVYPINGCEHDPAGVFGDMPDTVEVMHTHAVDRLKKFLKGRPLYYDTVWISRMHNLARIRPILSELMANGVLRARIVLDTEAVTPHREALHARLTGETYDLDAGMRAFAADANICQAVVAVTPVESAILQDHGVTGVSLIGHMIRQQPTARPFAERAGILFVGAIHQHDSPNLDSLIWFVDQVLPLIETELRWQTRLTIAGYVAPGIDLQRFAHHPRVTLHGVVSNLEPLYGSHRVFVAPTRFAAGAPYKVLEAASYGLPVIATDLLRGQLNWTDRQDILAAPADDPVSFAACVLALYRDADLWNAIRQGALQRLQDENAPEGFTQSVAATLGLHGA